MDKIEEIRRQANLVFEDIEKELSSTVLYHAAPCGIISSDANNYIVDANDTARTMFGYSLHEFTTMTWVDFTHPEDIEISLKLAEYQQSLGYSTTYQIPKRYITKQKNIIYCLTTVSNIHYQEINKIATILDLSNQICSWEYFHEELTRFVN